MDVAGAVLAVVAEKTGYPSDMLDLDLDLEADLGIDTVKQAEVFATIREGYGIERDDKLKLRDYPTLAHVVRSSTSGAPATTSAASATCRSRPPPSHPIASPQLPTSADADGVPRRVPVPTIRPPLAAVRADRCRARGGQPRRGRLPTAAGSARHWPSGCSERGVEVLDDRRRARRRGARSARLEGWLAAGPIHGVYWLPPSTTRARSGTWTSRAGASRNRVRVKLLYATARGSTTRSAAPGTFLVTAHPARWPPRLRRRGRRRRRSGGAVDRLHQGVRPRARRTRW